LTIKFNGFIIKYKPIKDKLPTIKEVANYLRVSERFVLHCIEAGRLIAVKVGYCE